MSETNLDIKDLPLLQTVSDSDRFLMTKASENHTAAALTVAYIKEKLIKPLIAASPASNTDKIDGYHLNEIGSYNSYDFRNGTLVRTRISANSNTMVTVRIEGNSYFASNREIFSVLQFYNYSNDNSILSPGGTHYGYNLGTCYAFNYDGRVYIWLPCFANFQTYKIFVHINANHGFNYVESVSNASIPASGVTRKVTITPHLAALTSSNVASATKLQHARTMWGQLFDGTGNLDGDLIFSVHDARLGSAVGSRMAIATASGTIAKGFNVGSLLVSNAWADYTKVPANGIYSKGAIVVDGTSTFNNSLTAVGKIFARSFNSSDAYGGAIEIREYGLVATSQSEWYYSPAISFHWGGKYVKRFGLRSDGLFAVDNDPIVLRSWGNSMYVRKTIADTISASHTFSGRQNFNGGFVIPYNGSTWLTMATRENQILGGERNSASGAHSLFMLKNSSGSAISYGGLGAFIGFYGFTASRIANGTNGKDWSTEWNVDTGTLSHTGTFTANRIASGYDSGQAGAISCNNWFRSSGASGWLNATYGGGIYMTDTTWVRVYNAKRFYVENMDDATSNQNIAAISTAGGIRAGKNIWSGANIVAQGEVTAFSDARLKSNIIDLSYRGRLTPKTYVKDGKLSIGFMAQEVNALYPELVMETDTPEKYLALNYNGITAVLQAQLNDTDDRVVKLEKRVIDLEKENKSLQQKLNMA